MTDEALPIRDTDPLHRRIAALDSDAQERLRDLWHGNGLGAIDPLVTTDTYRLMERLVATCEVSITGADVWQEQEAARLQACFLPENILHACIEACDAYADWRGPVTVITTGRLAEVQRIVNEAVAYAAEIADAKAQHPSSADLPPVVEPPHLEVVAAMADYPGPKAKADEVMAWVGDDRNRAARAYMHEQQDRTPRKGVTEKLTELLGVDGVAAVNEAIADSEPPPLDLTAAPGREINGASGAEDLSSPPLPLGADGNAEAVAASAPGAGAPAVAPSTTGEESLESPLPRLDDEPPAPEERSAEKAALYTAIAGLFVELANLENPDRYVTVFEP